MNGKRQHAAAAIADDALHLADKPIPDERLEADEMRPPMPRVIDNDGDAFCVCAGCHRVYLLKRAARRFFKENRLNLRFQDVLHHVEMVRPAHTDSDNVQRLALQHLHVCFIVVDRIVWKPRAPRLPKLGSAFSGHVCNCHQVGCLTQPDATCMAVGIRFIGS